MKCLEQLDNAVFFLGKFFIGFGGRATGIMPKKRFYLQCLFGINSAIDFFTGEWGSIINKFKIVKN